MDHELERKISKMENRINTLTDAITPISNLLLELAEKQESMRSAGLSTTKAAQILNDMGRTTEKRVDALNERVDAIERLLDRPIVRWSNN